MIAGAKCFFRGVLPVTLVVLAGCSTNSLSPQTAVPVTEHSYFDKTEHPAAAKWGYEGDTGPAYWGQLHPSYSLASTGKQQSPIDIETAAVVPEQLRPLRFDYQIEQIAAINNGHTIQHNQQAGSFLWIGAKRYSLEQFHAHTPSEHTLNGRHFPMELHLVHKTEDGEVTVVAVLVEAAEHGRVDIPAYYELPTHPYEETRVTGLKNAMDFLPQSYAYFEYHGSFTTPPCTEGVRWIVMQQPIQARPEVIQRFADILKSNNRPVQPLNERTIYSAGPGHS